MQLYFKSPNIARGTCYTIDESCFAITDRLPYIHKLCEEEEIIDKINKNEEGYFDFTKALIDIGAEDGNYAMLTNFSKNYCFEPNKRMCCLIYTNMYLRNKVEDTEVFNVALGEIEGEEMIFDGFQQKPEIKEGMSLKRCGKNGIEIIHKKTLDSYNIKNVGLIKTDTEGFDYFVLKGGEHTIIENNYPPILFERWAIGYADQTPENYEKLTNYIKSLGYTIIDNWGDHETHLAIKL